MNSIDCYNSLIKVKHQRDINSNFRGYHQYTIKGHLKNDEACAVRLRFPSKIPIIVDRYVRENELPYLTKRKFLVPQEITMSQFVAIIRNRLKVSHSRAIFLLINNRSMVSLTQTIAEIYAQYRCNDGFLYITYASQEVFG